MSSTSIYAATPEKATVLVLNGENYEDWKLRCTAFFRSRKLTRCVTTSPADRAQILAETDSKEADKWEQDEADTVYYLLTTLGKEDSPNALNLSTGAALSAYEIWSAVCRKYEEATRANRTALRRHLQQLRYRDGDDIDKYLNSFRKAASALTSIGAMMSDDNLTDMLLCSLPKSFDSLIETTEESDNKASFEITCSRVIAKVRREKLRLSEDGSAEASTAFYSRQDGNVAVESKSGRGGQGDRPHCNHCGRLGHDVDRCWVKHPELKPNRFKRRELQ
jgi:gag-polypeptide of LTR copia-type